MSGVRIVQGMNTSNTQECILVNSAIIDFGDFVKIDSNGFLSQVAAGDKIQGVYVEAKKTVTSDNQTVAKVTGKWEPNIDSMVFELTANQACTQTDLGQYSDVIVTSNAYTVNLNSGATGQLELIDFDPNRDGTTTLVRVMVSEPEKLAFAQS